MDQNLTPPEAPHDAGKADAGSVPAEKAGHGRTIIVVLGALLVIVAVGAYMFQSMFWNPISDSFSKKQLKSEESGQQIKDMKNARDAFSFAPFKLEPTQYKPAVPDYTLAAGDLSNLGAFEQAQQKPFSDGQKSAIAADNFFVAVNGEKFWQDNPDESVGRSDDWTYLYNQIGGFSDPMGRKPENSVFVSSDYLLHVYHRLLEKEFEYIEQKNFIRGSRV